jgi:hypothetical protein
MTNLVPQSRECWRRELTGGAKYVSGSIQKGVSYGIVIERAMATDSIMEKVSAPINICEDFPTFS